MIVLGLLCNIGTMRPTTIVKVWCSDFCGLPVYERATIFVLQAECLDHTILIIQDVQKKNL